MKEYKPFKSGKVRELYDLGDSLVMVCTDRISAFEKSGSCTIWATAWSWSARTAFPRLM